MRRIRYTPLAAAALLAACGPSAVLTGDGEGEQLGQSTQLLQLRIKEEFGEQARLQRVFREGASLLVGVAHQALVPDGDVVPPVSIAEFNQRTGDMAVLAREPAFREARTVAAGVALVTASGELRLRGGDGAERTLAQRVRGDVVGSADGKLLAMTLEGQFRSGPGTRVALSDGEGNVSMQLEDADRPALSPDGQTLVFVSGRTGIASWWRTSVRGGEPVQLTNAGIELGVEREGEPEGFVPPPVSSDSLRWVTADVLRYDAGGGELWTLNVRTGVAAREGGAR